AAAASLFKLVTGEYPREFPSARDPWQVVMKDKPRQVRQLVPDFPPHLAAVLDEALIDDPGIVFQKAPQLKAALLEAAAQDGLSVPPNEKTA
ncbi:MAG: hypothetical protein LBS31_11315, partial [Candidatus Adiutrix sp.]|nr:hypothetical protein [Candidatus Adiutrix sp.]